MAHHHPTYLILLISCIYFVHANRHNHPSYRRFNEYEEEIQHDMPQGRAATGTKTTTVKPILESDYSNDDEYYSGIGHSDDNDEDNAVAEFLKSCSTCHKQNPNCEHQVKPGNRTQPHYYKHDAEKMLRKAKSMPTKEEPWCIESDPEIMMYPDILGQVDIGGTCNPELNAKLMCKYFDTTVNEESKKCLFSTKVACKKGSNVCQALPDPITWKAPEHIDIRDGCLNVNGTKYYQDELLARFNNLEGKRLHNEGCEPFDDEGPEDRCMLVSDHAVKNYSSKQNPKPTCLKPTRLFCHPILKKCICFDSSDEDSREIHFQFGNKSDICFIRPTMDWKAGFTCGGRSRSATIALKSNNSTRLVDYKTICRCKVKKYLPYINTKCHNWWICKGSRIVSPDILVILLFVSLAKYIL